jgi:Putative cyclase
MDSVLDALFVSNIPGHWAFQANGKFYNGVTKKDIEGPDKNLRNGIQRIALLAVALTPGWSEAGGIAARGVLIDYVSYAERHNIQYSIPGRVAITHDDIDKIAKEQNVEFHPGDILVVRTGYVKWHNEASHEERLKGTSVHNYPGVEGSKECIEWMWEHHFAAVAADSPAFETIPPKDTHYSIYQMVP